MEKLEFVLRRYKQILPEPIDFVQDVNLRLLQIWLADDVSPVLEEYVRRPAFRDQATWVIRAIGRGADTPERRQIVDADDALVECARALSKLASKQLVRAKLATLYPPQESIVEETVGISDRGSRLVSQKRAPVDVLAIEMAQVAEMAKRRWGDLVNVDDYFEPQQTFVQMEDGKWVQRGEFIVSLNPELHPVGNFVVRCMFRRLDCSFEVIAAFRLKVLHALREVGRRYCDVDRAEQAWAALSDARQALKSTHQTGPDSQLRDSCTILTQVYAAFHPVPDLGWLNVSQAAIEHAVPMLQHRIIHFHNGEMFERIAAALGDLKRLYEGGVPNQSAMDEAIAAGGLVIGQAAQAVFWEGKLVKAEWRRFSVPWKFLIALAAKARHQAAVAESDLYDLVVSRSAMGTNAERLKKLLPPSLRKLIVPGGAPRSYKLDLLPHQVHLFE